MLLQGTMRLNLQGHLEVGGCDTLDLASQFGTPLLVYDEQLLRALCREYNDHFSQRHGGNVAYASKSFSNQAIYRIIEEEGLSLDVVSGGELYAALEAGFDPQRIFFHGNNKLPEELQMALQAGVGRIVIDNFSELDLLVEAAAGRRQPVDIMLRITPGVEAHTHEYISTGQIDSKFGFTLPNGQALEAVLRAMAEPGLRLRGLHCHIGSQIFAMESFAHTARLMLQFMAQIANVTGENLAELNLGGGFGIFYKTGDSPATIAQYADTLFAAVADECSRLKYPQPCIIVEPGRSISGPAGTTLYTVGTIKDIPGVRCYVAVDGGMSDNIRPALYQACYEALVANKADQMATERVTITGKCCESGDILIWDALLPPVQRGDLLALGATGAYCYAMASNYNRLGRPAVVLVNNGEADLIIKREEYRDLLHLEVLPQRLRKR